MTKIIFLEMKKKKKNPFALILTFQIVISLNKNFLSETWKKKKLFSFSHSKILCNILKMAKLIETN